MSDLARYKTLLSGIQVHLDKFSERAWADRLQNWISEIDGLAGEKTVLHLKKTQKALTGMGSIGDVIICPENGNSISSNEAEINRANDHLKSLVTELYTEIEKLLQ